MTEHQQHPTEPSAFGAILIYAVPMVAIGLRFGELEALAWLAFAFIVRGFSVGPLYRSMKLDENPLLHGREERSRRRALRVLSNDDGGRLIGQRWQDAVKAFAAAAIGIPLIIAVVLSVIMSLLGPGSCSSDNDFEREYRAR